jgi:hypothetical protein
MWGGCVWLQLRSKVKVKDQGNGCPLHGFRAITWVSLGLRDSNFIHGGHTSVSPSSLCPCYNIKRNITIWNTQFFGSPIPLPSLPPSFHHRLWVSPVYTGSSGGNSEASQDVCWLSVGAASTVNIYGNTSYFSTHQYVMYCTEQWYAGVDLLN